MDTMDIMDILNIMIITAWMAMAGAVSALVPPGIDMESPDSIILDIF